MKSYAESTKVTKPGKKRKKEGTPQQTNSVKQKSKK